MVNQFARKVKQMRIGQNLLFLLVIVLVVLSDFFNGIKNIFTRWGKRNNSELGLRGRQLRREIDRVYKKLRSENRLLTQAGEDRLKPGEENPNDTTDLVLKYIPEGMSFEEAKQILAAAGFTISSRAPQKPEEQCMVDTYNGVLARIDMYKRIALLGKANVTVYIYPRMEGEYGNVGKIESGFILSFP